MTDGSAARPASALRAVRELGGSLGLDTAGACVLKDANNTVVLLPAEGLVAKVSTSTLEARGASALERELMVGRRLAANGVRIARPADGSLAGPHHLAEEMVLTLWRYVAPGDKPAGGDRLLGGSIGRFHAALADVAGELPQLVDRVDRAHRLLQDADATPELTAADRLLAARAHERLRSRLGQLGNSAALHGEPHAGNILWTADGPVLIDFEAVCCGPPEWDLAYLSPAATDAFPHRSDQAIAQLRPGVSFCVAAWCHASLGRSPEVDRAAAYHLDTLKRSWLVTGQGP